MFTKGHESICFLIMQLHLSTAERYGRRLSEHVIARGVGENVQKIKRQTLVSTERVSLK